MNMDLVRKLFFSSLFILFILSILAIVVEELFLGGRKRRAMRKTVNIAAEQTDQEKP